MNTLEALRLLLQGYLGYDWLDEYGDPWAAVVDFARSEPAAAAALTVEIEELLQADASEETLRAVVVDQLDSGYLPEVDGWTYAAWLTAVATRVEEARSV